MSPSQGQGKFVYGPDSFIQGMGHFPLELLPDIYLYELMNKRINKPNDKQIN